MAAFLMLRNTPQTCGLESLKFTLQLLEFSDIAFDYRPGA